MLSLIINLRTSTKLAIAFASFLLVTLAVNLISLNSSGVQRQSNQWTVHTYEVLAVINEMVSAMVNQETGMRGYLLAGKQEFLEPMKAGQAAFTKAFDQTRSLTSDNAAQQKRLDELSALVSQWSKDVVAKELALMGDPATVEQARAMEISGAGKKYMDAIRAKAQEMFNDEARLLSVRAEASADAADTLKETIIIGLIVSAILAGLGITVLHLVVSKPLQRITQSALDLAAGDHQTAIPFAERKDEIGKMAGAVEVFRQTAIAKIDSDRQAADARQLSDAERARAAEADRKRAADMAHATSGLGEGLKHLAQGDLTFQLSQSFAADFEGLREDFNLAVAQLRETLGEVASATGAIDSGARELSGSANDLSKRTEQQAAALEETAAALDQITTNVSNSSKRTEEARAMAMDANKSARQSGEVVANAVNAMQRIEQSSSQISSIIGVIDEIAFQTNLLALNAGVEAARAGEAGKGFAVVAQEVRELAQRSAKAAKEIKDLIRTSADEVENGVKLVTATGEALKVIEDHVVAINSQLDAIATSAREQSVGLSEVNTAVNQMDQVTQQNAAMVEEATAASSSLAGEADKLRHLISRFQVGAVAQSSASYAARPAAAAHVAAKPAPRSAPKAAAGHSAPVASPARKMVGKIAQAFTGRSGAAAAAAAPAADTWEEF